MRDDCLWRGGEGERGREREREREREYNFLTRKMRRGLNGK